MPCPAVRALTYLRNRNQIYCGSIPGSWCAQRGTRVVRNALRLLNCLPMADIPMSSITRNSTIVRPSEVNRHDAVAVAVWEERWHPLREEWVIIAAHRNSRPWAGASVNGTTDRSVPHYLANCYLCPGNHRVHGARNDNYSGIFVFHNDLPCVGPAAPALSIWRRAS